VKKSNAPRRRGRTIAILLVSVVVIALAAYPIAGNAILAFGGVQKAFEGTDQVAVDFKRAWTLWPGKVHVEGARVTMQDRNVQFALAIEEVDIDIDLMAFTRRTFHATKVRGKGVSYRFRHRIEHEALGMASVGALPPIPEFHDPPLRQLHPPTAPLTEENYNLWTVHIDDVDVMARELWTQMFRYEGDAHVVGAFRLRPAKRLWVGPADLEFLGGKLTSGPHDVMRDMRGKLSVKVDDFDVEPVHGMEPFRYISARMQLAAQIANLDVLNFVTDPSPNFDVKDGSGLIDMDVAVDHGVFTQGARFNYRTGHLGVENPKLPFRIDGEIALSGQGPATAPGGHLRLDIPRGKFVIASRRRAPELHQIEVDIGSSNADITQDFPLTRTEARFRDIVLPELAWLGDLPIGLPRTVKIKEGRGHVGGTVVLHQPSQAIDGSISAGFTEASVQTESAKVNGTADILASTHVSAARGATIKGRMISEKIEVATEAATGTFLGRASVDADLALAPRGTMVGEIRAESGEWIADLASSRFSGASLSGTARIEPESVTGTASVTAIRTSILGACPWAEAEGAKIAARIDTPKDGETSGNLIASLEKATLSWGGFEARASETSLLGRYGKGLFSAKIDAKALDMKNQGGAPRGWEADVGSVILTTELALTEKNAAGPAHLTIKDARGQIGKTKVRGDIVAALAVNSPNQAHRTAEISGAVQARNIDMATKDRNIEGWWAHFDLDKAKLDMRQDFDLAGKVKARFRDGLPALYILADQDEIPGFLPNLVPLEGLSVDLGVERYCRWTDVQILDARGGPFAAEGRLQIEPGETRGALLLRLAALKPISLGLNFVEDYSHAAPLVGGSWLEKHLVPLTSAATEKHDQKCIPQPPTCPVTP
jgi:hypothetical protein